MTVDFFFANAMMEVFGAADREQCVARCRWVNIKIMFTCSVSIQECIFGCCPCGRRWCFWPLWSSMEVYSRKNIELRIFGMGLR